MLVKLLVVFSYFRLFDGLESSAVDFEVNAFNDHQPKGLNDVLITDVEALNSSDPEVYMNVSEIIHYHGYPVEEYDVTTEDGYILTIQRIPHGKSGPSSNPRKPVILQHGFICDSSIWVTNTPDKNLAYILAEAGYDVWLTNSRGNLYGKKHVKLDPKKKTFWLFSFDQMAQYDMPAIIDFILKKTGFNQTHYIGHSMGTTIPMAMLSTKPEYNAKIRAVMALAPVATVDHITSPLRRLAPFADDFEFILDLFGGYQFLPNSKLIKFFANTVCKWRTKILCANLLFLIVGYDEAQLNETRLPVFISHTPAGSSTQNFIHYAQIFKAKVFQYFDYGTVENLKKYGQRTPPEYDLTKIMTPFAIYWSDNDALADPQDVAELVSKLKHLVLKYRVPLTAFDHLDYMWAVNGKQLVYNKVLQVMGKLWKDY